VAGDVSVAGREGLARLGELAWEARRTAWARGWQRARRVDARVVSVGNLTVGGAGKTTLVRHLAAISAATGTPTAVVCRRYRPGPEGVSDEERLLAHALPGVALHAGKRKVDLAAAAAAGGARVVIVDDGFSHWALARDVEIVLVDVREPLSAQRLLPGGRLREPWRALQRADFVIASRLDAGESPDAALAWLRDRAPAARFAAGRHAVTGVRGLTSGPAPVAGRVRVVTGTGHPESVARTAREAGLEVVTLAAYRDHHWFTRAEAERETRAAAGDGARVLLTAKDAVRWPLADDPLVLEVEWRWVRGGEAVERAVTGGEPR